MSKPFCIYQGVYIIGSAEISHPLDCCVYLIDAGELILIDSGAGRSFSRLVDNTLSLGLAPERITKAVATHAHIDHIGSLAKFQKDYRTQIISHNLDAEAIETGRGIGAESYGLDYEPCHVNIKLKGEEGNLVFGEQEFIFLHIPGHTPGSIAVYADIGGKRILFGQDIHGPYATVWGGEPKKAIISLKKLLNLEADILCEGHLGILNCKDEVKDYIASYIRELEGK